MTGKSWSIFILLVAFCGHTALADDKDGFFRSRPRELPSEDLKSFFQKQDLEDILGDIAHHMDNALANFSLMKVSNVRKRIDPVADPNETSALKTLLEEPNFENGEWYFFLAIDRMANLPPLEADSANGYQAIDIAADNIDAEFLEARDKVKQFLLDLKATRALADKMLPFFANIDARWNALETDWNAYIGAIRGRRQLALLQAGIDADPMAPTPASSSSLSSKPNDSLPAAVKEADAARESAAKQLKVLEAQYAASEGANKVRLYSEIQIHHIRHNEPFDLSKLHPEVGPKDAIARAIGELKDVPRAMFLINTIIRHGVSGAYKKTWRHISTARGAAYELLTGAALRTKGAKVLEFGKVITFTYKGNDGRKLKKTFEYDIVTSDRLIECKDWYWEGDPELLIASIKEDFIVRRNLAKTLNKEFTLYASRKIPKQLLKWLQRQSIPYVYSPVPGP